MFFHSEITPALQFCAPIQPQPWSSWPSGPARNDTLLVERVHQFHDLFRLAAMLAVQPPIIHGGTMGIDGKAKSGIHQLPFATALHGWMCRQEVGWHRFILDFMRLDVTVFQVIR